MRATLDLYEHPELSYSEVWEKDAYNRSGRTRILATFGVFSVVTLSTLAGFQYSGLLHLSTSQLPSFLQASIV